MLIYSGNKSQEKKEVRSGKVFYSYKHDISRILFVDIEISFFVDILLIFYERHAVLSSPINILNIF